MKRNPGIIGITPFLTLMLVLATACGLSTMGDPTPRPTYTPYPPYEPEVPGAKMAPTTDPDEYRELGDEQWFFGNTLVEMEKAEAAFREGRYQDALEGYQEAQRVHGKPSGPIQNWIANSYQALGQDERAVQHYTNAIEIEDNTVDRLGRSMSYLTLHRCQPAIEDAKSALAMEPAAEEGFHSDAEANVILASCYAQGDEHLLALQHIEAALEIAEENGYPAGEIETVQVTRDAIKAVLDGREWPEDLIFEPALTHFNRGAELMDAGRNQQAIESFEAAQSAHHTSSGAIELLIGHGYSNLGDYETAIRHYTRAIEIRESGLHRAARAAAYVENQQCEEATTDARKALEAEPYIELMYHTSVEAHSVLGICYHQKGDGESAQRHFKEAARLARVHGYLEDDIRLLREASAIN